MRVAGGDGASWWAGPERDKYAELNEAAPRLFEVAGPDEADIWVYPYMARERLAEATRWAAEAGRRGVECLFFSWGDADEPVDLPSGTAYRHALVAGMTGPREAAVPAFTNDVLRESGRPLIVRPKGDVPSVGFCGFVGTPVQRWAYRLAGRARKAAGLELRARILRRLRQRRPAIDTRFITRNGYWAGTMGRGKHDVAGQFAPRAEFLANVADTDYTVCVRGAGNFSYRLYEVLSAGRIPLFVNTRCVLPFPDQIDWRRHVVWVEEAELDAIGDVLVRFHRDTSAGRFEQMQRDNRQLWEEYLSPVGFYRHALADAAGRRRV